MNKQDEEKIKNEKSWRLDGRLWLEKGNLEDASYQYTYDASNDWAIESPTWRDVQDAFKAGAEWKEQQMIEKACHFLTTHNRGQLCNQFIKAMMEE